MKIVLKGRWRIPAAIAALLATPHMSANTSGDEIVILPVGYRQERHNDVINAYGRSFHVQLGYFLEKQDPRCVVLLGASIIPNTAGSADVSGALTTTTEKTLLAIDHGPSVSCDGPP